MGVMPQQDDSFENEEDGRLHKEVIADSWQRCINFGLNHQDVPEQPTLARADIEIVMDQKHQLIQTTHQQVLPYYENILFNTNSLVVLADQTGNVLQSWGDRRFIERRMPRSFDPGYNWAEQWVGTNAIGTAIATGQVVDVSRNEHFLLSNRFISGSAAPIFDSSHKIVGVIDISSDAYVSQRHTTGMVKLVTKSIENRLMQAQFGDECFLMAFSTNLETMQSPWSGLIAFTEDGRIVSANRRAQRIIGDELSGRCVADLFDMALQTLTDQPENTPACLNIQGRFRVYGLIQRPSRQPLVSIDLKQETAAQRLPLNLDSINTGDPRVAKAIRQAKKVLAKDIPILIRGETGVGKEIFVKALHASSDRRDKPLIAVNCAAIPSELVESELFGYEKGAFTGANAKGSMGLIRQAHTGILFLDEIGDMPLQLQARLLRVLQERAVTPLGSTTTYPVDIKLVSATNRCLREQVAQGLFRQDIYYRISGLNIELPPLRERQDKEAIFEKLLAYYREATGPARLSHEVRRLFLQHPWPGNIRQLANIVQIAATMAVGSEIEPDDLPEDFFLDIAQEHQLRIAQEHQPHMAPEHRHMAQQQRQEPQTPGATAVLPSRVDPKNPDHVRARLDLNNGNISKTAEELGISRNTLYKRIREPGY